MRLLYHYTDEDAVTELIEAADEFGISYEIGTGNVHGDGMYATSIEPVDEPDCLDDVIRECFGGTRTPPQVSWVLVLRNFGGRFEQVEGAPEQWVISGSPMELIDLTDDLVCVMRWRGDHWETVWPDPASAWGA